jgi:AraC-like DNA-binding protein
MGFRIGRGKGRGMLPVAHAHADIEVNFLFAGGFSYLLGGSVANVEPLRMAVFWGGVPHCILTPSSTTEMVWITIPLNSFLQWQLPPRLVSRVFGGEVVAAARNEIDRAMIERWEQDFESGNEGRRRALLLEIEARFHRLASEAIPTRPRLAARSRAAARSQTAHDGRSGWQHVERITDYIARNYREPLSVDGIAAALKLHGKYLMRLFKRHSRMSVWEYVTRMRLANAQRLLLTSEMKIIDVALESGFGSLGPFYRAFAAYSAGAKRPMEYRRGVG